MLKKLAKKSSFLGTRMDESQILFAYRYISLFVAIISYALNTHIQSVEKKALMIFCLSIAAIILSFLYLIHEGSNKSIKRLLLIETLANSILLIPSGGINSPLIWYTLNTILISAIFLERAYCWINLLQYILFTTSIAYLAGAQELNIIRLIKGESNLVLSYIMIIVAVQVWSIYIREIKDKNKSLEELNGQLEYANETIMATMEHIKALYQSVNILNNRGNRDAFLKLLFSQIKSITKTDAVFYYDMSKKENKIISYDLDSQLADIGDYMGRNLQEMASQRNPVERDILGKLFIIINLQTNMATYGILGIRLVHNENKLIYMNNMSQLRFLSDLISMGFEKFYFEGINERLIITEEQNRIANEIHDSVLQRLFSMSCGIFSMIKNLDSSSMADVEIGLNDIRKTTDRVMKELREKIYGLSWKKLGHNSFIVEIENFIEEIKRFNNINIPFSIEGNISILSYSHKGAIYRIICEGIGNAVRHGRAKNIELDLIVDSQDNILSISDDGIGFEVCDIQDYGACGIGMRNIKELVESLSGEIKIQSELNAGTKIQITIPNNLITVKEVEAI